MRSTLQALCRTPAAATATATFLRSIAASALLASTLLGAGAVQASLVVTSASASLSADTSGSSPATEVVGAVGGVIDHTVQSQVFLDTGDGALARAKLEAAHLPTQLFAAGDAELLLSDGVLGTASLGYQLLFTLSSRVQLSGIVGFRTSGSGDLQAGFDLALRGPTGHSILSATETSPDIDVLLTLDPGDYIISGFASAASGDVSASGAAGFLFNLTATELGEPPLVVPEPHSMALVLAGLLASAVMRRRSWRRA